jgi:hypothetical protein
MRPVRDAAMLLLAILNLTFIPADHSPFTLSRFVTRRGALLLRNGKPFRFVGVNCYRLTSYVEYADAIFATLATHGVKVVRFWAFQPLEGSADCDFSNMEMLLAAAKRYDILLLPVLENHWSAGTFGEGVKLKEWYAEGWRTKAFGAAPLPYRDFLLAVAAHFRDEPQILTWQLINEPEIYPDTDENFEVLQRFVREAADALKQADPNHLISLGLLGLGQPSTAGRKFRALHDLHNIDLVSAHDHGYIYDPMPGRGWLIPANVFCRDLCDAASLDKPFLATEAAIPLSWVKGNRKNRAELFRRKLNAFVSAGGTGYLLWNYEPEPDTESGFDANDPVLELIGRTAARLSS